MNHDNVNHPQHYMSDSGIEVIDVIQAFTKDLNGFEAYCTGNIIKYICRYNNKNGLEDLQKAEWYLKRLIDIRKKSDLKKKSDSLIWKREKERPHCVLEGFEKEKCFGYPYYTCEFCSVYDKYYEATKNKDKKEVVHLRVDEEFEKEGDDGKAQE